MNLLGGCAKIFDGGMLGWRDIFSAPVIILPLLLIYFFVEKQFFFILPLFEI